MTRKKKNVDISEAKNNNIVYSPIEKDIFFYKRVAFPSQCIKCQRKGKGVSFMFT